MRKLLALFLLVAGLLCLVIPVARGQGTCVVMTHGADQDYIRIPSSGFYPRSMIVYSDADCQTEDSRSTLEVGLAYASNEQSAYSICSAHVDDLDFVSRSYFNPRLWLCFPTSHTGNEAPETKRAALGIVNGPTDEAPALVSCRGKWPSTTYVERIAAAGFICWAKWVVYPSRGGGSGGSSGVAGRVCGLGIRLPLTGLQLHAFDGMGSGIEFNRLDNCGVGDPSVIDMGFLDAVDIWSNIGSGYEVCFPQPGRIVFLDAATAPRSLIFPDYNHDDGWTCASMGIAGTMVLVNAPAGTVAQTSTAAPARRPGTDDSIDDAIALEDCTVTPRVNLRLREAPWGTILDVIPRDTEVSAKARTESWFNVTYDEINGWSAAWLADSDGDCDWTE